MFPLDKNRNLSLYIHIPYCSRKCDYCAFYSESSLSAFSRENTEDKYVTRLRQEISKLNAVYQKPYHTVFIGGGNPGILQRDNLEAIIESTLENGRSKELTVESNPENIDINLLRLLMKYNVRLSVGFQSFNSENLKIIGRNGTRKTNLNALSIIRESGINFNGDLITSVPFSSPEDTIEDIRILSENGAGHISLYNLTFEENTPLYKRANELSEDKQIEFLEKSWNKLRDLGFEHYEISSFAKNGKRSIHNQVYWDLEPYIGLGPAAESSLIYNGVTYSARNGKNLRQFLESGNLVFTPLTRVEELEEYLIVKLRTKDGINKSEFKLRFNKDFDEVFKNTIKRLDPLLYRNNKASFALSEGGFLLLDTVILELASVL